MLYGIQTLEEARNAAATGADYLLLNLDRESSSSMSPAQVPDILQWIKGPAIIADLGTLDPGKATQFAELLDLPSIMLKGSNLPARIKEGSGWLDLDDQKFLSQGAKPKGVVANKIEQFDGSETTGIRLLKLENWDELENWEQCDCDGFCLPYTEPEEMGRVLDALS